MSTYIVLFKKTDEGRQITAEDAQERRQRGIEISKQYGTELRGLYYGLGEYEMVAVADAPDSETIAKVQLAYEQDGLARTEAFEVFEPAEWDSILEEAL